MVLFSAMVSEGFEPSGVVLASVLSACAQSSCSSLGKEIHAYIDDKGVEMNVILGTALINMYAKNGELIEARRIFDGLRERNAATWNAMICGLAPPRPRQRSHPYVCRDGERERESEA
ncbi:hypothetical protein SASPL_137540 [Salvia splendens]|uniref:Pentatricopeptide repeat-containing protein n=1 Tax=Salvia splendens TaxID=180675 RepID=A0A8X8WV56_SALSN|nr:hypothetical protein SASPL_137540 [Salvia splendens]